MKFISEKTVRMKNFFLKGHAGGSLESTVLVHIAHRKSFLSSITGYFICFSFFKLPVRTA